MSVDSDKLKIHNFQLKSSTQIDKTVEKIEEIQQNKLLIHIVSYMHNTVLVQNLYRKLKKAVPKAQIVLLKHENKTVTSVTVFSIDIEDTQFISDEILKELYVDNHHKQEDLNEYRIQLFKRYFTDNLTNLPNLYQLRKDLQSCDEGGLILLKIDNFQMINNFCGFVVGDYVLEYVGKYLKDILIEHQIYRLSGAEYAVTTETRLGFYELKEYLIELYDKIKNIEVTYQDTKIRFYDRCFI